VSNTFNGQYLGYATGSGGALIPSNTVALNPFPPASISNAAYPASQLPMYTPTGTIVTLPPPSDTGKSPSLDGWADNQDTASAPTPIQGCAYPNAYSTTGVVPLTGCSTAGGSTPTRTTVS
jgi:glucan 1,3-beta-glucosidase